MAVERDLIDHARGVNLLWEVVNKAVGGEGLLPNAGYYAIYVLPRRPTYTEVVASN